jgi:hypothetical protein
MKGNERILEIMIVFSGSSCGSSLVAVGSSPVAVGSSPVAVGVGHFGTATGNCYLKLNSYGKVAVVAVQKVTNKQENRRIRGLMPALKASYGLFTINKMDCLWLICIIKRFL